MNITIDEGVINYRKHSIITKYSDSTKKDIVSKTMLDTTIVFKDGHGVYPDGKIISSNEIVTSYDYDYTKDENGNIVSCRISKNKKKNGKSIDIEKINEVKYYDELGRHIKTEYITRDGITYLTDKYSYDNDNNIIEKRSKGTHTVSTTKFNRNGEIYLIEDVTLKSKAVHTEYRAFFDNDGRVYKVIDGNKHIETDYERDLNDEGKVLSETIRYFDISSTTKKLISYKVTSYNPVVDYKIDKVIENGILKERHIYDLKGDEIGLFIMEDDKELFIRNEKTIDDDTGNTICTRKETITDKKTGDIIKDTTTKSVYDINNNLLMYALDNSMVTDYEYDEEGKRKSAITKKLIGEEFVVINEVLYTYETTEEGTTVRTRQLTVFNEKGEVNSKTIHKETITDTSTSYEEDTMMYEEDVIIFENEE